MAFILKSVRGNVIRSLFGSAAPKLCWKFYLSCLSHELSSFRKFASEMSGHTVPADFSGHMLDLDEDEDLEVFSKVKKNLPENKQVETNQTVSLAFVLRGFDRTRCRRTCSL